MTKGIGKAALALVFGASLLATGACTRTQNYMATGGGVLGGAIVGGAIGTGAGYIASR